MSHNHSAITITIFLITVVTVNNGLGIHNEIKNSLFAVLRQYLEKNSSLLISYDEPDEMNQNFGLHPNQNPDVRKTILKTIMETEEWTIQISSEEVHAFRKDFPGVRLHNALIFLHEQTIMNEEKFSDEMRTLRSNPLWYPYGRVIVIFEKTDEKVDNKEWSRRIIDKLWKSTKNDDMLVMIPNTSNGIEFYTWFPYRPPYCSEVKTIVYLDTWVEGKFKLGVDLYPEKITSDLKGCDFVMVTASCIPYVVPESDNNTSNFVQGIEIEIIKALSRAMHFNIKLVPTPDDFWITTTEDNEIAGAFKLLSNQEIDLAFSCMMLNFERYYLAEPLPSYFDDSLIWLVPTPNQKSHIYDLFKAFPIYFWFLILITFISFTFAIILIVHFEHRFGFSFDQKHSSISYIVKMIGLSTYSSVVFNTTSILLRTAIIIFLLYSLHMTTAFQASLFNLFRLPAFEDAFETLQEAVDAGLHVYLRESTKGMYNQSDHEVWNTILQPGRYEYLYDYDEAFEKIATEKSAIALYIKSTGLYIITYWYSNKLGLPKILYLPDRFTSYPVTMYMSPGSPLFPEFQSMIYRLIASGLVDYWYENITTQAEHNPNRFRKAMNRALGLEHFIGAFYLLLCLLILASLVFLIEILCFKFCRKKQKQNGILLKMKNNREIVIKRRKENAVYRNNWFLTRQNDVPENRPINEFLYSEFSRKKNNEISLS